VSGRVSEEALLDAMVENPILIIARWSRRRKAYASAGRKRPCAKSSDEARRAHPLLVVPAKAGTPGGERRGVLHSLGPQPALG
jgi:hypothetical protein